MNPESPVRGTSHRSSRPTDPYMRRVQVATAVAIVLIMVIPIRAIAGLGQGPPVNTSLPTTAGAAVADGVLSGDRGAWTGRSIRYAHQWMRCDTSGGGCRPIDAATSTTYVVRAADVAETIRFTVIASNRRGSVTATSEATDVVASSPTATPPIDQDPPTTPSNLGPTSSNQTSISVSWSASSDNFGVAGYRLYANDAQLGETGTTSFNASGLACGTSYTLGVEAFDAALNRSARATTTGATNACPSADPAPSPAPESGSLVWKADMEEGSLADWFYPETGESGPYGGGEYNDASGDSITSTAQAQGGSWSAKMVLPLGAGATRLFRWKEPRERVEAYYTANFFFPQRYSSPLWWNIFQFKSRTSSANDPFWVVNVGNRSDGSMYLYLYDWINRRSYSQSVANLPVGRWVEIKAYLSQSSSGLGRLTIWQDGTLLWDLSGISTKYADGDQQWSVNSYTEAVTPTPVVTYVDNAAISVP